MTVSKDAEATVRDGHGVGAGTPQQHAILFSPPNKLVFFFSKKYIQYI